MNEQWIEPNLLPVPAGDLPSITYIILLFHSNHLFICIIMYLIHSISIGEDATDNASIIIYNREGKDKEK